MPSFGKLFWLNILFFGTYALLLFFRFHTGTTIWFSWLETVIILCVSLPLFGINLTVILEKVFRIDFDFLERISIASILALLFPGLLLTLQYTGLHILFPALPIINSLFVFLIAISIHPLALQNVRISSFNSIPKNLLQSGILIFLLYLGLVSTIVTAYYPLPESDPYYWILKIRSEIDSSTLADINSYRPLLSSLSYVFHVTAGIDLYGFFKYLLPFLPLLTLLPAALVARFFSRRIEQSIIFLLPLSSASFIIYSELPIPQSLFNICIAFFLFFLLYAWFSGKSFFYFFSGTLILATYFYHELALLVLLPWLAITLFFYHTILWKFFTDHTFSATLFLLLIASHADAISPLFGFIKNWLVRILQSTSTFHTNFSFPLSYVNIDGKTVGWGTSLGVMQYYAFYVGPVFFLTALLGLFVFRKTSASKALHSVLARKEPALIATVFLLFFFIAEIFPRFFNIALLPERAWGFAGFFSLALLPIIFKYAPAKRPLILFLLISSFFVNVGAAAYINSTKKYLITSSQIASTHWIASSLPKQSLILTHGDWSVMKTHTGANFVDIAHRDFYTDITVFDSAMQSIPSLCPLSSKNQLRDSLLHTAQHIENFSQEPTDVTMLKKNISQTIAQLRETEEDLVHQERLNKQSCTTQNLYIYYAQPSNKNPYHNRPYFSKDTPSAPIFDLYPQRFERIYEIGQSEVIIWKVLQ